MKRSAEVGWHLAAVWGAILGLLCGCAESKGPSQPDGTTCVSQPAAVFFKDVTQDTGIDFVHVNGAHGRRYLPETMGAGGCALDFDGDGFVDLYLVQSGKVPGAKGPDLNVTNRLFRNRGDGSFEDVTAASGTGCPAYGQGAVAGDYDNDGHTDLYVVNFGPNVLLRNNGNGTFSDVTARAGVGNARWGSSAAFFDADQDGDLDLYVVNYLEFTVARHIDCGNAKKGRFAYCHPGAYAMAPDVFYRNRGDGTFVDATREAGLTDTTGKGLGIVVADLVGQDGRPDIYVANDATPNFLYQNLGNGRFEEVGLVVGVAHNDNGVTEAGMGTDVGDVNGDGFLDIFVTNLAMETNAVYLGGRAFFSHATARCGLHASSLLPVGFGAALLDLDNDTDLDIFVANGHVIDNIQLFNDSQTWAQRDQVFLNDGRGRFTEADNATAGDVSVPRVSRATITLDYDNDGRVDVLVVHNNDRARLYRNEWPNSGHWVGFRLVGRTNRSAIGARVIVAVATRSLLAEVTAGSSYQSSNDPRLHFGLGQETAPTKVTIRWPSGSTTSLLDLKGDRYYTVTEGRDPNPRSR